MKLTGQAQKDFQKWYVTKIRLGLKGYEDLLLDEFYNLPDSMQYGVYVDWFDSVRIYIDCPHNEVCRKHYYTISLKPMANDITCYPNLTRKEARKAAIEKANEIYNTRK